MTKIKRIASPSSKSYKRYVELCNLIDGSSIGELKDVYGCLEKLFTEQTLNKSDKQILDLIPILVSELADDTIIKDLYDLDRKKEDELQANHQSYVDKRRKINDARDDICEQISEREKAIYLTRGLT